jgi:hypothetical protein
MSHTFGYLRYGGGFISQPGTAVDYDLNLKLTTKADEFSRLELLLIVAPTLAEVCRLAL